MVLTLPYHYNFSNSYFALQKYRDVLCTTSIFSHSVLKPTEVEVFTLHYLSFDQTCLLKFIEIGLCTTSKLTSSYILALGFPPLASCPVGAGYNRIVAAKQPSRLSFILRTSIRIPSPSILFSGGRIQ